MLTIRYRMNPSQLVKAFVVLRRGSSVIFYERKKMRYAERKEFSKI